MGDVADIAASVVIPRSLWRSGRAEAGARELPEETPIALVHDAATTAVMMGTPADLEDFGVGFSLTEGVVSSARQITGLEIAPAEGGIEVRLWLVPAASATMGARRRRLAGPTGCGLCGVESLAEALRPVPRVGEDLRVEAGAVIEAMAALGEAQPLGARTRAAHAAAWWTPEAGVALVREDVGRHNALDKLVGALARHEGEAGAGVILITSRVSVEMVQKAATAGAQVLAAVSAPTALALRPANAAGKTLIAVARTAGVEVFAGAERVLT
jgi:FdhD protein